jgi:transcription initiation factor TFIIE subunit alpha
MDQAQVLVRMVARSFYDSEAAVIVDALVRHVSLNHSDLSLIFANSLRQKGQISEHLGRLKTGGLIKEFSRDEIKNNAMKSQKVTYYYIDYRHAVDATKFRLHQLGSQLRRKAGPAEEKKEYRCPRCKSEWKEIDVIGSSSFDGSTFLCLTCGHDLEYIEQGDEDAEATGPVGIFNKSLGWLITQMQVIDKVSIPATTSDFAFANREELPRSKAGVLDKHNEIITHPHNAIDRKPAAVKGLDNVGPQKVKVVISTDADNTAESIKAAAEEKARLAAKNALPDWHLVSTVSNDVTAAGAREAALRRERDAEMLGIMRSEEEDEKKNNIKDDDGLADIFAEIEAEQAQEMLKREREGEEESEEEEEDEEEDFEFEDVTSGVNGNGGEAPDAKRVKMEVDTPVSHATGSGDADDSEPEFEDV